MDPATSGALAQALYREANVVPSVRARPSISDARGAGIRVPPGYSPDSVDPLQDSGGFNCVVELSAATCLAAASHWMTLVPMDETLAPDALMTLVQAGAAGGALASVGQIIPGLSSTDYRGFRLALTPQALSFPDNRTVAIAFLATISFVRSAPTVPPRPPHHRPWDVPPWFGGIPIPDPGPLPMGISGGLGANYAMNRAGALGPMDAPREYAEAPSYRSLTHPAGILGMAIAARPDLRAAGMVGPPAQVLETTIGSFQAELRAPLKHIDDAARCRSRAFAALGNAEWQETPPAGPAANEPASDLRQVYDALFAKWLARAAELVESPENLPITPTLSLVGRNASGVTVPEIQDFEVEVFPVKDTSAGQALAFAFDTAPRCHGIDANVRHFIGPNPYGLISDEFIVASVLHHKWNRGGFDRWMNIQNTTKVKVKRNGHEGEEDAIVYGYEQLLSLDSVAIVTEGNTRTDYVRMGGQAQAVPTSLRMVSDGQTFNAGDIDLGPPQTAEWGFYADLEITRTLDSDPEVRDFQIRAEQDGVRHLSRPFAYFQQTGAGVAVTYSRVEGVSKHVMYLGSVDPALP